MHQRDDLRTRYEVYAAAGQRYSRSLTWGVAGIVSIGVLGLLGLIELGVNRDYRVLFNLGVVVALLALVLWNARRAHLEAARLGLQCPRCGRTWAGEDSLRVLALGTCPHCKQKAVAPEHSSFA